MNYPGGKNGDGVYHFLINQIPPHQCYIEGFLGSGAILRNKQPAELNIGIDRDPAAIALTTAALEVQTGPVYRFICADYTEVFNQLDQLAMDPRKVFIYLDPPYLFETRRSPERIYKFEMGTEAEHRQLLELIRQRQEMIMISGYPSQLYDQQLAHWRQAGYNGITHRGDLTAETIWMNYPAPTALHEYTYLGENALDRQRIKRKIQRHVSKLAHLPTLERAAILKAFENELP